MKNKPNSTAGGVDQHPCTPFAFISSIAMSQIHLDNTFGATYVGGVCATFLYGIMTLQTYMYWMRYPDDSTFDRMFILVLWVLDTFHMVCVCHLQYHYVITNYANPLALASTTWSLNFEVGLTAVTTFMVQAYFARRAWYFTKRVGARFTTTHKTRFMGASIGIISLAQLAFGLTVFSLMWILIRFERFPAYKWLVGSWLGAAAACDILIVWMLSSALMTQRTGFGRTDALINKVLRYTVNTGLLTSIFAVADLIAFCTMDNLVHFGFNFILGKLYTNTLLATLNSRNSETTHSVHVDEGSMRLGDVQRGQGVSSLKFNNTYGGTTTQDPSQPTVRLQTETSVHVSDAKPQLGSQGDTYRSSKVVAINSSGEPYRNSTKDVEYDADGAESTDTRAESWRK